MHGADVRAAQTQLNKHGYLAKADIDGAFGGHSGEACERAKFRLGYASIDIKPTYGDVLDGFLKGTIALPKQYKERQKARASESFVVFEQAAIRSKIVSCALWGVHNSARIHYEQSRPIQGINNPYELPLWIDCSGFVTLCYQWGGGPDPNGRGYDGEGFTGTLLEHMHPIMKSQVKIGDIVVWGTYPGHHTAVVIGGPNSDPLLASHGNEEGPYNVRYSQESRYQPNYSTWLRIPTWV
jgi:hypothetical protein